MATINEILDEVTNILESEAAYSTKSLVNDVKLDGSVFFKEIETSSLNKESVVTRSALILPYIKERLQEEEAEDTLKDISDVNEKAADIISKAWSSYKVNTAGFKP